MILETPCGTPWPIEGAPQKLALRAQLPGARVFDLAAAALGRAREAGLDTKDRLALALPASWLVNNPATSRMLRRWALSPSREQWVSLVAALDVAPSVWAGEGDRDAVVARLSALGDEPYVIEAVSKVLALLSPRLVPLFPPPARAFLLGAETGDPIALVTAIDWFAETVTRHDAALRAIGRECEGDLAPAQVLDRLLWFDSEGHRHFAKPTSGG